MVHAALQAPCWPVSNTVSLLFEERNISDPGPEAGMFFTSGYVFMERVPVKSIFLHTFRNDFLKKVGRS